MKQLRGQSQSRQKMNFAMRDLETSEVFDESVFWPEGLTPFPFQKNALPFIFRRDNTYIAYEPGLGKTVVARLVQNWLANCNVAHVAHFICPPFLSANVETEFKKWGVSKTKEPFQIFRDSQLDNVLTFDDALKDLHRFENDLKILFVDEAHRFKNEKAMRAKAMFELAAHYDKVIFLSGTPLPNSRPIEIWPIVKRFAPDVFGTNFFTFAKRYCAPFKNDYGKWNFNGFSNRKEFTARITESFMLRLKKKDALDLPAKIESLLTVGDSLPPLVGKLEKKLLDQFSEQDLIKDQLTTAAGKSSLHMSEYLRHLGEYKLKYAFPYIEYLLQDTNENIIIFAHHKQVIEQLRILLHQYRPLVIVGSTPVGDRQKIVDEYQARKDRRVFIGNILACGVGLTITKADRVIVLEPSWRDGDNQQAIDRAHRIGREGSVIAQYVVLKDSFDAKRLSVVLAKRSKSI